MPSSSDCFSQDYAQARAKFRRLAKASGASVQGYRLAESGPAGETLATDIARAGDPEAGRALVVQSGVHGVEAFAGSAIQCSLLDELPALRADTALVLVHVVNPWGMSWLRRVNSSNVDLNRNCLGPGDSYTGAPGGYAELNALINPASPPRNDLFKIRAAYRVLRHGKARLEQAVAAGQYEFPTGLFYGGSSMQPEIRLLRQHLYRCLAGPRELMVIDLHTGLGRYGEHLVFPSFDMEDDVRQHIEASFGCPLELVGSGGDRYSVTGSVSSIYEELFPDIDLRYFTVEFGTEPPLDVLRALRDENRHHFHSDGGVDHWSKRALRRALCPDSVGWRERVVADGRRLVEKALGLLGQDSWCAG